MKRTLISRTRNLIDSSVNLRGWVNSIRSHGKITFIDLRDRTGIIQIVTTQKIADLKVESVISVTGKIQNRQASNFNPNMSTGKIEMFTSDIKVLAPAQDLPFDIHQPELNASLPIMLDHRAASLRHPKIKQIFQLQATITQAFRQFMLDRHFTEFHAPTLVATATEGGSQVFSVDYFDRRAFLAQSPQFYKQIMVSVFEKVFTVSHAYRAEPSVTTRHLTEYVGLDVEFGFINSWRDIYLLADKLVKHIFAVIAAKHTDTLKAYNVTIPKTADKTPVVKLSTAQDLVFKFSGHDIRGQPDMDPEAERQICQWSAKEHGSDLVFITHFPTKKRPWYTYPNPKNPAETLSFDLIGGGVEWITGGQRITDYQALKASIKKTGADPKDFDIPYLQAFRYGMPPEGGFCIGLERITQNILNLDNVRQATLFPRDMERIDVRLSTLNPPKPLKKTKK